MSYIVEQRIKGNIYLYRVEAYWDKEKQQARQRRVYLGPKDKKTKLPVRKMKGDQVLSKSYGNIFFLRHLAKEIGLYQVLKSVFPNNFEQILALSFYEIMEASPLYLFEYWQQDSFLPETKTMDSQDCSSLCEEIGKHEASRLDFFKEWIENIKPIEAVYYDITSISSYSTNIDFVEWGYNRDKENLPQINMGVLCNQQNGMPLYYNIFPGSIVDVTTLRNNLRLLHAFDLKNVLMVMDRGFFSTSNVEEMNQADNKIRFIQPLPLSLKKVRELISQSKKTISSPLNAFQYNEEILYSKPCQVTIGKSPYDGHLYFNEKAELDQKQHFLSALLEIENRIKDQIFMGQEQAKQYIESSILIKYQAYYKWNPSTQKIEKNLKAIDHYFSHLGCYLMITNSDTKLENIEMLNYYRNKDRVEKLFDLVKNEMDGNRLRAHNEYTNKGRLFIMFVTLVISSYINNVMSTKKLFKAFSMKEMLAELKKIKRIQLSGAIPFASEVSKKQKNILEVFNIPIEKLHSY
jgi:transposase